MGYGQRQVLALFSLRLLGSPGPGAVPGIIPLQALVRALVCTAVRSSTLVKIANIFQSCIYRPGTQHK